MIIKRKNIQVSLFPFLSVLTCLIGTLTLLIVASAQGQLLASVKLKEFESASRELSSYEKKLADLKKNGSTAKNLDEQLKRAQDKYEFLRQQLLKSESHRDRKSLMRELENKIKQLQKKKQELEKEKQFLYTELANINKLSDTDHVMLLPGGSGVDIKPFFIECKKGVAILYNRNYQITSNVPEIELKNNNDIQKLFNTVKSNKKNSLIFLVRRGGVFVYDKLRSMARKSEVRNGKLPLLGDSAINFTKFRSKS